MKRDLRVQWHSFTHAQRLRLEIIVAQHELSDFVGHFGEQLVALLSADESLGDHRIEQYLDIDFVVRAIHTGGIVNGVGVDLTAIQRIFDAAKLGEPEISTFGDHLAAQFGAVYPDRIVRAVAYIGVALMSCLHIGADSAVIKQIHRRLEERANQIGRGERIGVHSQDLSDLRGNGDRFRTARSKCRRRSRSGCDHTPPMKSAGD